MAKDQNYRIRIIISLSSKRNWKMRIRKLVWEK